MISIFTYLFALIAVAPTAQSNVNNEPVGVEWEKILHDFGDIEQGSKVKYTFYFTNTGQDTIQIMKADVTCGCTVPNFSKTPILAGGKGSITVIFDSSHKPAGRFTKNITVTTNKGVSVLGITGVIKMPVVKPKSPVKIGD